MELGSYFVTQPWNDASNLPPEVSQYAVPPAPAPEARRASRGARGTTDKTGQATRARHRAAILKKWGPWCWLCLAAGLTQEEALINLDLKWPDPECFTRDHVKPRSQKGRDTISNMRPAHHRCNAARGNAPVVPKEAT